MTVKAVVFDWAGTMIDFGSLAPMGAFVRSFAQFDIPLTIAQARGPMGLPKHDEDFGQTLGVWGVKSGPYLVLPFFGSSTVRDGVAKPVDLVYGDTLNYIGSQSFENTSRVVRIIDDRAAFLGSTSLMEGAALDPYQFYRDAYLQRREARVRDGQ